MRVHYAAANISVPNCNCRANLRGSAPRLTSDPLKVTCEKCKASIAGLIARAAASLTSEG